MLKKRINPKHAVLVLVAAGTVSVICGAGLGLALLRGGQTESPGDSAIPSASQTQEINGEATAPPGLIPGLFASPTQTPTMTATPTPDPWIETTLANMTVEQKMGQMLAVGVEGFDITPDTCAYLGWVQPGAVVYRGNNVETPDQLRAFSLAIEQCVRDGSASLAASDIPMIIALDHEGQYVYRFQGGATLFPAARAVGATGNPALAYEAAWRAGLEIRYSGANMVLGPTVDVLTNPDNAVIGLRSYANYPAQVTAFAEQAMRGYQEAGLLVVLKHFPGHGATAADSHVDLPVDGSTAETVLASYLLPYHLLTGHEADAAVMVSHVAFPAVDASSVPSSLSSPVINLVRDTLAFDGVVMTDSLGMGAITTASGLSQEEATLRALQAGSDMAMVLPALDAQAAHRTLVEAYEKSALGEVQVDQSVRRILALKNGLRGSVQPLAPNWLESQQVAQQIGYEAVHIYRDEQELVPIPADANSILAITPAEVIGLDTALTETFQAKGMALTVRSYESGIVNNPAYARSLGAMSTQFDLVIAFTYDAHLRAVWSADNWQTVLINELVLAGQPLIVVALKTPVDLFEFPAVGTYIATYGTTPGQIQGLVDGLIGNRLLPQIPFEFTLPE